MYNRALDVFMEVAAEGSFMKASENLFISHTAVIKQINGLESRLGVRLFQRSHQGVILTEAGRTLMAELPAFTGTSDTIIAKVRKAAGNDSELIRVASSAMYPCHSFMDVWDELQPPYMLQVVDLKDDREFISLLGREFDFVTGPVGRYSDERYGYFPLGEYRFCLAVPRSHPLSRKKQLSFKDLCGEKLMIMHPGVSAINDKIRSDVETYHKEIDIVGIRPAYDHSTFDDCAKTGILLLSLECWDKVHPQLKSIPLEEDYRIPYGIIYTSEHSAAVDGFLDMLRGDGN